MSTMPFLTAFKSRRVRGRKGSSADMKRIEGVEEGSSAGMNKILRDRVNENDKE